MNPSCTAVARDTLFTRTRALALFFGFDETETVPFGQASGHGEPIAVGPICPSCAQRWRRP